MSQDIYWYKKEEEGVSSNCISGVNIVAGDYDNKSKTINLTYNKGLKLSVISCNRFKCAAPGEPEWLSLGHKRQIVRKKGHANGKCANNLHLTLSERAEKFKTKLRIDKSKREII